MNAPRPGKPVEIVGDAARVGALLSPVRRRLLAALVEPGSAAALGRRLEMSRQRVNYHLRELERQGYVELAEERQQRGCVERVMRRTARSWIVDPALLGDLARDPDEARDRFASAYLARASMNLLGDVAVLRERAAAAGQRLATLTIESEVTFASPSHLRAFAEELAEAIARLAARHGTGNAAASGAGRRAGTGAGPRRARGQGGGDGEGAGEGPRYRIVVGGHPVVGGSRDPNGSPDEPEERP